MNIESTGLIFFSPTKTTKKIVEGIAQGLQPTSKQYFDLTLPGTVTQPNQAFIQDLAIIGAPVYAGRLVPPQLEMDIQAVCNSNDSFWMHIGKR
jgi:hypothetical protein